MGKDDPWMPGSKESLCFWGHGRTSVLGGAHEAGGIPLVLGMDPPDVTGARPSGQKHVIDKIYIRLLLYVFPEDFCT